ADLHPVAPDPDRADALTRTAALAAHLGAEVRELTLVPIPDAYETMAQVILFEGRRNHRARGLWPARAAEYGEDVRRRLLLADGITAADYRAAVEAAARVRAAVEGLFDHVDAILGLSSAVPPLRIDANPPDAQYRRAVMACTAPQSLAGVPACVFPTGLDSAGLPVGLQLTGPRGSDLMLLELAAVLTSAITPGGAPHPRLT
ncbi:MAG: amidase family protein, partial [Solirubrobacteraceae bacterium]